jgi:hypothetical protein
MSNSWEWSVECPVCHAVFRLERGNLLLPKHQSRDAPLLECLGEGLVGTERPGP